MSPSEPPPPERPATRRELEECELEPIHAPGAVQSHGVLLALDEDSLTVVQASVNTIALLDIEAEELLGRSVASFLQSSQVAALRSILAEPCFDHVTPLPVHVAGHTFDVVLHRSDGLLIVELEPPAPADAPSFRQCFVDANRLLGHLRDHGELDEIWPVVVAEIRRFTGFDRVMAYRFHGDEHGEVVAEAKRPEQAPYLGLHYPASDIPQTARRLYIESWIRLIVDARYQPAPLVPELNPRTGRPIDLGRSVLRSVSRIHREYLRNMGVVASMSISLVVGGRLWGMIMCHHEAPRHVPHAVRQLCILVGQLLSARISDRADAELRARRLHTETVLNYLIQHAAHDELPRSLLGYPGPLLELVSADGAALLLEEEEPITVGEVPPPLMLRALGDWLRGHVTDEIFATDSLAVMFPAAAAHADCASGLLSISLAREPGRYLLWLRREQARTVTWAGDPNAVATVAGAQLAPRKSFEAWREQVRLRSLPWQLCEREAAHELRDFLLRVIADYAINLERLNRDLREALGTRDDFLSMASHELRTPIATLRLVVDGLGRVLARGLALGKTEQQRRLELLERQVSRLEQLVSGLLDVSRLVSGKLALDLVEVDLASLTREVVDRMQEMAARSRGHIDLVVENGDDDGAHRGFWDPFRLDQVLTNLLSNAIKYGAGGPIEVRVGGDHDVARLEVRDQGIGIPPEAQARIFDRFERAAPSSAFGGVGLGLWIVRRLVEAHEGEVSVESAPGHGARFIVTLPRRGPAAPAPSPEQHAAH